MELKNHTVLILVGPSMSGKSTWAGELKQRLEAQGRNCAVLSSDSIRRELVGADLHRHDPRMLEVSKAAFEQLYARLRAHTSFPVNTDFVVVDTTGLQERFRAEIRDIAVANGYDVSLVLFDYKTKSDYLTHCETDSERAIVAKHVDRFRQEVLPALNKRRYADVFRVRDREGWGVMPIVLVDEPEKARCEVRLDGPVAFIGDIHESTQALDQLLPRLPADIPLVLLGDWMDKGGDTVGIVERVEQLVENRQVWLIAGNHERYLAGRLRGTVSAAPQEVETQYFTALKALLEDPALAARFLRLADRMVPYLKITGDRKTVYATHAPGPDWAIGKLSERCVKAQVNLRLEDRSEEAELAFIRQRRENADGGWPWHVFGHIAHGDRLMAGNQVWLDTGAVHGGKLTAVVLTPGARREASFIQADGPAICPKTLPRLEQAPPELPELTPDEERTLERVVKEKVRFISGTMSPAPSRDGKLEPLEAALDYFKEHGVERVVLQPKYMGSRCQVYLTRGHPEEAYAVTRNGNRISWVPELPDVLAEVQRKMEALPLAWESTLVLDGELMPWHAVGSGLIERDFKRYREAVGAELAVLDTDPVFHGFEIASNYDLPARKQGLATFDRQLELYGMPGELHYKPFTVLAVDGEDATESDGMAQDGVFAMLSGDTALTVELADPEQYAEAQTFFQTLTTESGMEGVVVKPLFSVPGVAPYMKVRNEDYLHLIYGHDYKLRYDTLVRSKRVGGKLRLSIQEWKLGRAMLSADDHTRRGLAAQLLLDIRKEAELDPRL